MAAVCKINDISLGPASNTCLLQLDHCGHRDNYRLLAIENGANIASVETWSLYNFNTEGLLNSNCIINFVSSWLIKFKIEISNFGIVNW